MSGMDELKALVDSTIAKIKEASKRSRGCVFSIEKGETVVLWEEPLEEYTARMEALDEGESK